MAGVGAGREVFHVSTVHLNEGAICILAYWDFPGDVLWAEGRKEGRQEGEERKLKSNVNPSRPIHAKQRSNAVQDN